MAALQASMLPSSSFSPLSRRKGIAATLHAPKFRIRTSRPSLPKLPYWDLVEELNMRNGYTATTSTQTEMKPDITTLTRDDEDYRDSEVFSKLHSIMESVADRAEMHANIGEQRDNWNHLLLTSINAITVTAATMAGIAAISGTGAPCLALKLSSGLLYSAATGMLLVMNKIQPSQLAEEQRNATRLFKQLHNQIQTILALGKPTPMHVDDAIAKLLAIDRAYPLPLLGKMLQKFPATVEPAMWWPKKKQQRSQQGGFGGKNGWSQKLEEQMREIVGVLKKKDVAEYMRLSGSVLKVHKVLAVSSPLLTGLAAIGAAFVGSPSHGSWAVILSVVAGSLATVVNSLEHGGQVGMVFEMYRNSAGFFRLMEETIESNMEKAVDMRENGELLEMKVALQLGRSLSELRELAASSSSGSGQTSEQFAGKLF